VHNDAGSVLPTAKASGKYIRHCLHRLLSTDSSNLNVAVNTTALSETSQLEEDVKTQSPSLWPADTEIKFIPGTDRVRLTMQGAPLRKVIQDAFENVRASILFEHAFPDVVLALSFIRDALITAAGHGGPTTISIYSRLMSDNEYLLKIVPLVSTSLHPQDNITDIL
jgi:hypothetical protein